MMLVIMMYYPFRGGRDSHECDEKKIVMVIVIMMYYPFPGGRDSHECGEER